MALLYTMWYEEGSATHLAPQLLTEINSCAPPSKQKSMSLQRTSVNLSWGILVYSVEKSNVSKDSALLFLLSLWAASNTGVL